MVPLDLNRLGAAYYTGNCHKWLCAPKAVGFLHVRRDRQQGIQPTIISHGWNKPRPGYSPFQDGSIGPARSTRRPGCASPIASASLTACCPADWKP